MKKKQDDLETYLAAARSYAEGNPTMTDAEFDTLERKLMQDGKLTAPVERLEGRGTKVKLPRPMQGLRKVYPTDNLPFDTLAVITPKYDGVSLLVQYKNGKPTAVYTRGRKGIGHDVTHLFPEKDVTFDVRHKHKEETFVRFELVASWEVAKNFGYSHPQRLSTACITGNEPHPAIVQNLMTPIPLYVVGDGPLSVKVPTKLLLKLGKNLDVDTLSKALNSFRSTLKQYPIDGVVVFKMTAVIDLKADMESTVPTWAFAFKQNQQHIEATVSHIEWQPTAFNKLKPVVILQDPVVIDGISINRVTAHNLRTVRTMGIGKGAILGIVRGGDVIPYIETVITPAKPDVPLEWEHLPHDTVDIRINSDDDSGIAHEQGPIVNAAMFARITQILGIEGLGDVADSKVAESKMRTRKLLSILFVPRYANKFLTEVCGLSPKQLENIVIPKLEGLSQAQVIAASHMLPEGFGIRRITAYLHGQFPKNDDSTFKAAWDKHYPSVVTRLELFFSLCLPLDKTPGAIDPSQSKGSLVWTGYRSKGEEAKAMELGYTVASSVSSKTKALFVNNEDVALAEQSNPTSAKANAARKHGVTITTFAKFMARAVQNGTAKPST